ncbi:MAG: ATP-dependent DNA helicase, partial [Betaproteobacteria bacterium]
MNPQAPTSDLAAAVLALMGPEGPLARHDPAYRQRGEQTAMAQAVARAMEEPHTLVVEAGTGVGKTYAYLIPLLLSGRRGLVSTATKSLQDQLYWRDLPQLCERLGVPVTTALLKGRASYLSRNRIDQARHAPEGLDRMSLRLLARVEDWARSTASGDLSEVPGLDERTALVPLITSTRENCLGSECPAFNDCHVMQARRQAMAADLVVVNHHLFFADLALKEGGMAELLPAVEVVVFDEAHQILDTGLQFVATSLGTLAVVDLARDLRVAGMAHARGLQDWLGCTQELEQAVRELVLACDGAQTSDEAPPARQPPRGSRRIRWTERCSGRSDAAARPVEVAFSEALAQLEAAMRAAHGCAAAVAEAHPDLQRLAERALELLARLAVFQAPLAVDRVRG